MTDEEFAAYTRKQYSKAVWSWRLQYAKAIITLQWWRLPAIAREVAAAKARR